MHLQDHQHGAVLIIMLVILVLGMASLLAGSLNSSALQTERGRNSYHALAQAREALLGDAISQTPLISAGYLRLPDLGFKIGLAPSEGSAAPNFSGNSKDHSVLGKLPWKSLASEPLRDGEEECLWYAVSGRFKNTPATDALNWDTQGQINIADEDGNLIANKVAVLIVAPGRSLDGQQRTLSDPVYAQCGGNYDARNYLDAHNSADAISGTVNYFSGSTNNRIAADSGDKLFIMTNNSHYNDRFITIGTDDIFRVIMHRVDFAAQISSLLGDVYFQSASISGTKGTDSVSCTLLDSANQTFCKNWKEMLLLTQLPAPSSITVDGMPTGACNRLLIFGGQKTGAQQRLSATDKTNPANYLEGANLAAFATPTANAGNFSGASAFDPNTPSADLLKCLP